MAGLPDQPPTGGPGDVQPSVSGAVAAAGRWRRDGVPLSVVRGWTARGSGRRGAWLKSKSAATAEKRPVELYLEVEDVEAYYGAMKKQGIKPTAPLTDQWWGDRTFTVLDPFGYQIWFYQNFSDPKLPKGAKVV